MLEREMHSHAASYKLDETRRAPLENSLRGELITPASAGYDEARTIYNAMIDKRPARAKPEQDTSSC